MQHYSTRKKFLFQKLSIFQEKKECFIYSDARLYSPVSEISGNFMKQLKENGG